MSVCAFLMFIVLPALAGGRASIHVGPSGEAGDGGDMGDGAESEAGAESGAGTAFARQPGAVLARVGDPVVLNCRILRLGDRVVSWVRSRDLQILAHAGAVFTADARVSVDQAGGEGGEGAVVHALRIDRVRLSDAGRYECQVNTEPKLSAFFNLTVTEDALPTVSVRMLGASTGAVTAAAGGALRLACEARYDGAPAAVDALPPLRIRWDRDGETLDPQGTRGGVSLDTERWAGRAVSRLTLARLGAADGGLYSCSAAGAAASRRVLLAPRTPDYDDIDEELESMQRDQAAARTGAAGRGTAPAAPLTAALAVLAARLLLT